MLPAGTLHFIYYKHSTSYKQFGGKHAFLKDNQAFN